MGASHRIASRPQLTDEHLALPCLALVWVERVKRSHCRTTAQPSVTARCRAWPVALSLDSCRTAAAPHVAFELSTVRRCKALPSGPFTLWIGIGHSCICIEHESTIGRAHESPNPSSHHHHQAANV